MSGTVGNPSLSVRIGNQSGQFIVLSPLRRSHQAANDYWDGNWVKTTVRLSAGAFRGEYEADLRVDEFLGFRNSLAELYKTLKGEAAFSSMEQWLEIHIKGDGKGHMTAECVAKDCPGTGNYLTFDLELDQTDLPPILDSLNQILGKFPIKGKPTD